MLYTFIKMYEFLKYTSIVILCTSIAIQFAKADSNVLLVELGPKRLYSFENIGDQVVVHWPASVYTNKYVVQFIGSANQTGSGLSVNCQTVNVTTIVRQNAIPLPNPRNAIIPENTLIEDDGYLYNGSFLLSEQSQGQVYDIEFNVSAEEANNFFVSLFLPYDLERFDVSGLTKDCRYYATVKVYAVSETNKTFIESETARETGIQLKRQQQGLFQIRYLPTSYDFNLTSNSFVKVFWDIFPLVDSGGTIAISIKLHKLSEASDFGVVIVGCLSNSANIKKNNSLNCSGDTLTMSSSIEYAKWHVPFPSSGTWILELALQCGNISCDNITQRGQLSVSVGSCIDDCNADKQQGSCGLYRSDSILYSACKCKVNWMGLACNDGRNALSYATQLLHTLLLTLSNIIFLPCVCLAIYRKFYTEALVYFFVAFMSSFYHACDQPGKAVYCIMPYDTLQFSDFLSSITAIWFTLIAVAKVPTELESFLQVLGLIALAVCVSYNRFNVWTTVVPAIIAVVIVGFSWGIKSKELKHCYPGLKKTLFSIVPGVICAGVGLSLFAFVETSENYYIVHSIWHILMGSAVLFLLPVNSKRKKKLNSYQFGSSLNGSPISTNSRGDLLAYNLSGSVSNL